MKKASSIILLLVSLLIAEGEHIPSYSTPGLWSKDLYFRRMDFSTVSLRERAMGGAGIVSSNSAGALFTNSAQLVRMEGAEIGVSFDLGYTTEPIDSGFFEPFEDGDTLYTDGELYTYDMKKFTTLFAPKGGSGQLAFALYTGNSKISSGIEALMYSPMDGKVVKTGLSYLDDSFEIGLTSGYGHSLPSKRDYYSHSVGLTIDLNYQYQPNFGDAEMGLKLRYILGYLGEWYKERRGSFSLGATGGRVANPVSPEQSRFEYSLGLGWSSTQFSNSTDGHLDFSLECGMRHDLYGKDSYLTGVPNPYGGVELTIIEMFALRTGLRKEKLKVEDGTGNFAIWDIVSDGTMLLVEGARDKDELELSYGIGFTPFPIVSLDFATRTFLYSSLRKGQSQYAFDFRFHW